MRFCKKCDNMYYTKIISDEDEVNKLVLQCRNCGDIDSDNNLTSHCISEINMTEKTTNFDDLVNEYTKYDPTLPRTNKIRCPNTDCASNAEEKKDDALTSDTQNDYSVIFIRYDHENLKYIYLCENCNTVWKSNSKV